MGNSLKEERTRERRGSDHPTPEEVD